jgi:hypothetical protein
MPGGVGGNRSGTLTAPIPIECIRFDAPIRKARHRPGASAADCLADFFHCAYHWPREMLMRERKLEPEDALELERSYLEALLRIEAHAAAVAHELGLAGLQARIVADRQQVQQLLRKLAAEEGRSGNAPGAS